MTILLFADNELSATPLLTERDENGITHLSLRKFLKDGL